jgi:N-acetylglucosaminyldiphosphoundecaprenol N-acetyl-beta-D-mannosaminyltransferase
MANRPNKFNIFNVKINAFDSNDFFCFLKKSFKAKNKAFISKINTEFLLRALDDTEFRKTLNEAEYSLTDGKGVLWVARYLTLPISDNGFIKPIQAVWQMIYSGASLVFCPRFCTYPIPENIPGVDAMYLMLEAAIEADVSVYFFGAEKRILETAVEKIQNKYPKLQIAGYHDGYNFSDKDIIGDINKSGAKLLIVALGSPKQEYWIQDNFDKLTSVKVAVGEGGSLDFVAGAFRRAPRWMQKAGMEWFWRLFMNRSKSQTGSRFKRVWNAVPVFIYQVVKYKIENGATKVEK